MKRALLKKLSFAAVIVGLVPLLSFGCATANRSEGNVTVQILHASDMEAGMKAIDRAPLFAAIVDALEDTYPVTVRISAGDNFLTGPFFSAGDDESLRGVLQRVLNNPNAREGAGRVDMAVLNIVGFEASCFGNHEFDQGTGVIRSMIGTDIIDTNHDNVPDEARWLGAQFPYLSTNLDFSGDKNLSDLVTTDILPWTAFRSMLSDLTEARSAPKIASATVIEVNGVKIGVVGVTTPMLERLSSPGDTRVKNPGAGTNDMNKLASQLQPVIDSLRAMSIDKIILASHLQRIELEQQLVKKLKGVDVVLAGGSHTLLADEEDIKRGLLPGDRPRGPYPIVTVNGDGDPALVVSTPNEYAYVGRLVVTFDGKGRVLPELLDQNVSGSFAASEKDVDSLWASRDAALAPGTKGGKVKELTDAVRKVVSAKDSVVWGFTSVFLNGASREARSRETNLGDLTADANLAAARAVDPTVSVSFKNSGGMRDSIGETVAVGTGDYRRVPPQANSVSGKPEGGISELDIEQSLRFNGILTLLTVTAADLKTIVEHGVAGWAPGVGRGGFPQIGGMAFSFDPALPPKNRVRSLALKDPRGRTTDVIVRDGKLVGDPDRPIRLVTFPYLAKGGDAYPFPKLAKDVRDTGISERKALADYLKANFPQTHPFAQQDTPAAENTRIQNLSFREDTVLK